jgi:hypothetical protein
MASWIFVAPATLASRTASVFWATVATVAAQDDFTADDLEP